MLKTQKYDPKQFDDTKNNIFEKLMTRPVHSDY